MATATKSRAKAVVTCKRHTEGFKREALGLAEKIGVSEAARELGLHSSQLYGWWSKAELVKTRGQVDQEQAKEIARLKRRLAEKEEGRTMRHRLCNLDDMVSASLLLAHIVHPLEGWMSTAIWRDLEVS